MSRPMILVVLRATPTLFEGNLVAAPPKSRRGVASSDPGEAVDPLAWGRCQQAMETAQHWDRLAKNQPAEITMFQISEVQESPAFNGRRSFLTLRASTRAWISRMSW